MTLPIATATLPDVVPRPVSWEEARGVRHPHPKWMVGYSKRSTVPSASGCSTLSHSDGSDTPIVPCR